MNDVFMSLHSISAQILTDNISVHERDMLAQAPLESPRGRPGLILGSSPMRRPRGATAGWILDSPRGNVPSSPRNVPSSPRNVRGGGHVTTGRTTHAAVPPSARSNGRRHERVRHFELSGAK